MSGSVYLQGSEDVSRAASSMRGAAETMSRAAGAIDDAHERFLRQFRELVERFESATAEMTEAAHALQEFAEAARRIELDEEG